MDTPVFADQQKPYVHQLYTDSRCHVENLPRDMVDFYRLEVKGKRIRAVSTT